MKYFWLTLCMVLLANIVSAQLIFHRLDVDSSLLKKYHNDTTGFTTITDKGLADSLKPSHRFVAWEVNITYSKYIRHWHSMPAYKNLWRYPQPAVKPADSVVLTTCDMLKCYTACLCPDPYPWYISAKDRNGQSLTICGNELMKQFLGNIDNPYNALMWLHLTDETLSEPGLDKYKVSYKKVKKGYLLRYTTRVDNIHSAHVTIADVTLFVGIDFRILFISEKNVVETNYEI